MGRNYVFMYVRRTWLKWGRDGTLWYKWLCPPSEFMLRFPCQCYFIKWWSLRRWPWDGARHPWEHLMDYRRLHTMLVPFVLLPSATWVWSKKSFTRNGFWCLALGLPSLLNCKNYFLCFTQSWVFCYCNINRLDKPQMLASRDWTYVMYIEQILWSQWG